MKRVLFAALITFSSLQSQADDSAVHGMLVVGKSPNGVYLSHLPMFHSPHDYQVILEADLGAANKVYTDDQKAHPEQTVYTIAPEKFVLPDQIKSKKPFLAKIFRGHFENQDGVQITGDIKVEIKKVLHFEKFRPDAERPDRLTYLIFGGPSEIFMVHLISEKPDFDQVMSASSDDKHLKELIASKGIVKAEVEGANIPSESLKVQIDSSESIQLFNLQVKYTEFNDLQ